MMTGGHLGALYQPAELIIIGGAGGAFIVGTTAKIHQGHVENHSIAVPSLEMQKRSMDLLALLYRLMAKSRQHGGMFSLERDIENPKRERNFAELSAHSG